MNLFATLAAIWLCLDLVVIFIASIVLLLMPKINPRWWRHIIIDDEPQNLQEKV